MIEQLGAICGGMGLGLTVTVAVQLATKRGFDITPFTTKDPAAVGVNVTILSTAIGNEFIVANAAGPPVDRMTASVDCPSSMTDLFIVIEQDGFGISETLVEHTDSKEIFFTLATIFSPSGAHSTWAAQP